MSQAVATALAKVQALYDQGLYVSALEAGQELGELRHWRGTRERVLAGRLAYNLGAPQLGRVLHRLAHRDDPGDPEAIYFATSALIDARGLLDGWEFMSRHRDLEGADDFTRADWFALRASTAARLRDFDLAHEWIERAAELGPVRPWISVERSWILEAEDRYEESLEAARHSLELKPWYRPGVQAVAHILELLGLEDEAIELLSQAASRLECCTILSQLGQMHSARGEFEQSRTAWERFGELAPLLDRRGQEWLAGRLADSAYRANDLTEFDQWAQRGGEVWRRVAERVKASPNGKRVVLPVGFIRQHHLTCAPATLTTIARYWSKEVDHLEVAEKICYDGTPHHSQRDWATQNGWEVREFTITQKSVRELIDRGIPFTLTTVDPGNAHLQAVIGYDTRRGSLIIRDPFHRHDLEFDADETLERYASTGPRGMAMVPSEEADRLADLELTDSDLFDSSYQLQTALRRHDRDAAGDCLTRLHEARPEHAMTLRARLSLADYDADPAERLQALEALLSKFPRDANLLLAKLSYLRELASREERLELLKEIFDSESSDPILWHQYAQELAEDPRQLERAEWIVRRAIRTRAEDASLFSTLATIHWSRREFDQGFRLFRFAACLDRHNEKFAQDYFVASRPLDRTAEVFEFLHGRFRRFARQSGYPGQTLFWAYSAVDDTDEAFSQLETALEHRPSDGELLLFAADAHARYGNTAEGERLLARAEDCTRAASWQRTAAALALYDARLEESLELWKEIATAEPLAMDAHRAVSHLLSSTAGHDAAANYLTTVAEAYPHNYSVHQLLIEHHSSEDPQRAEEVIRHLLRIHPADGWTIRELALTLASLHRFDEALEAADHALEVDPTSPASHSIRGYVATLRGDKLEAKEFFRAALHLSVDHDFALQNLLRACETPTEREAELAFVQDELVKQVIRGEALIVFQALACETLDAGTVVEVLEEILAARPDLWHAWSATITQHVAMGQLDTALALASDATSRFRLLPRLWLDLASVHQARRDFDGERAALRHALEVSPDYGPAVRQLALLFEREGNLADARQLLNSAVARSPLDPANRGYLAELLWKSNKKSAAFEQLRRALLLDSDQASGWQLLLEWAQQVERPEAALELANDLTDRRPGETRSWRVRAQILAGLGDEHEALGAIQHALKIDERCVETHDLHAKLLATNGRTEEALAACEPPALRGAKLPVILRARQAWVHAMCGDLSRAIELIEKVVGDDPSFCSGWQLLADWYDHTGDDAGYERAALRLTRLTPNDALAHGHAADAHLRRGDRGAAKVEFRRALDLSPGYFFAGVSLFDLHLEDDEVEEAASALRLMRAHDAQAALLAFDVRLAIKRSTPQEAIEHFGELCRAEDATAWSLGMAGEALVQAGKASECEHTLLVNVDTDSESAQPLAACYWIDHFAEPKKLSKLEDLYEKWRQNARMAPAVAAAIEFFADNSKPRRVLKRIGKNTEDLRNTNDTWVAVGYAYLTVGKYRRAAQWLADWETRSDVTPRALFNLMIAWRKLGQWRRTIELSSRAIELPRDHTTDGHLIYLALESALTGEIEAAEGYMARVAAVPETPYYEFLVHLFRAILVIPRGDRRLRQAMRHLRLARKSYPWLHAPDQTDMLETYRRATKRISKDSRRWYAALWRVLCVPSA